MNIAIITGASRGIGRASAKRFAKEGYSLILNCEKNWALLEDLQKELLTELQENCPEIILCKDLEKKEGLSRILEGKKLSKLLLLANSGKDAIKLLQDYSEEETKTLLNTNLLQPFLLCQNLLPYLLQAQEGRILFSSSVWGNVGASMESLYSLSKGGLSTFAKALGKELAPSHIAVNAVAFGAIDTDINSWLSEEEKQELEEEIPYGRMATVEEAADFLYLLSNAPLYLTAQVIPFDGGWI